MEEVSIIKTESDSNRKQRNYNEGVSNEGAEKSAHAEAVEFVDKHRDLFEYYARGAVKFEPAPEGLNTFAFDLEKNTIYVSSRFYKELGLSDERTSFATFHEVEHFLEKKQILAERGGDRIFAKYLKSLKESEAYKLMDNCVADIRENRAVISKTNKEFVTIETSLYKEDLFKDKDFTKDPKHIQFCQALLREARVPDEQCIVAPEVREKLDTLKAMKVGEQGDFIGTITDPAVPMSLRLKLQDAYILPIVKELLEQDMKEEREKKDKGKGDGKDGKGQEGDKRGKGKKTTNGKENETEPPNPNEVFKEAYERAKDKIPNAVPVKEIEKAFKKLQDANKESPLDRADREKAEKLGVKKEDLQRYRNIVKRLEETRNTETGVSIVEELRNLIQRIIARRLKKAPMPRYPVEEGEELVDPAELVAEVKAGNLEPKVWETHEIREVKGQRFGEVEITLVCDRSNSMQGKKLNEQLRAAVLMMEALKEFAEQCDEERVNIEKPLEIRSEVYSFQQDAEDSKPLKKMSKELGEKERIEIATKLSSAPGSTTDFVPLETIYSSLEKDEEIRRKITEGELKKIVIVFTDGESDDSSKVRTVLEKLRNNGVVAIGVGITESGKAALTTYAPDARLAEIAEKLPYILADLLKEHLANV